MRTDEDDMTRSATLTTDGQQVTEARTHYHYQCYEEAGHPHGTAA